MTDSRTVISELIHGSVLLIDDEEVIRNIGQEILGLLGLNCITAPDGPVGLDLYRNRKDDIGLVILDVEMPGMNGAEVYTALVKENPKIKILVISGYEKSDLEKKYFGGSIPHFMAKPFEMNQLVSRISRLMED